MVEQPGSGAERPRVVVGVDGSSQARAALVWAVAAAARREADLLVIATFAVEVYWGDPHLLDERHVRTVRADTETGVRALVDEVLEESGSAPPGVEVVVSAGPPAGVLVDASEGAALVVVGSRGRGAVRSTVLGSVALHCVTHARCPVVVVRPRADGALRPPRVAVGLDGSATSQAALDRAAEEAARAGGEVLAVAAYSPGSYWGDAYQVLVPPPEQLREDAARGAEAMADAARMPGGPVVRTEAVEGAAGDVLVRAAEGADLLVVGSRGRGALRGILLGSVALHCVLHAPCPVLVVHPDRAGASTG
jgi:nucleotide-binding universal stress UspA family protein